MMLLIQVSVKFLHHIGHYRPNYLISVVDGAKCSAILCLDVVSLRYLCWPFFRHSDNYTFISNTYLRQGGSIFLGVCLSARLWKTAM